MVKRLGLSDRHAAMASGLAGGVGMSGGGCGALGAAVWVVGMNMAEEAARYDAINAKATEVIERYLEIADYELECAEVVGRTFEAVEDHAAYLRDGGCAEIIDELMVGVGGCNDFRTGWRG